MNKDDISVRELLPEDQGIVRQLGFRVFSLPMGLLMAATMGKDGLIAEDTTGTIIGSLIFRTTCVGDRKLGIIDWALIETQHQGKGVGKALATLALEWFRQQNCDKVITFTDGYNSAALNAAQSLGMRYWPESQQIREFGWRWPKFLIVLPHVGLSTFILHLPLKEQVWPKQRAISGVKALIGVTLFLGLILLPLSRIWFVPLELTSILWGVSIVAAYTSVRSLAVWWTTRVLRLPIMFRLWSSGLIYATLLAINPYVFIPAFGGSFYINKADFDYSRDRSVMGRAMFASVAASLALFTAFTVLAELNAATEVAELGRYVGVAFGLTDTVLIPFGALPAGQLWRWRRSVWLAALTCFLSIWLLLPRIF